MSEFKRIKNKITKRHYTGILKGEALYLVKTVERLLGEVELNRLYDLGLDKDYEELQEKEMRTKYERQDTTRNTEGYRGVY